MDHARMVRAFLRWHRPNATGATWYRAAQSEARRIARATGVPVRAVAGIIAALSPRQQWATNVRMAETLCRTGTCGGLGNSVRAAQSILSGQDPLDVLRGPKVRAFFRAITGDDDAAVVDVWMIRAAGVEPRGSLTSAQYERVARALRAAAARVGIPTATFQAQVWVAIRDGRRVLS